MMVFSSYGWEDGSDGQMWEEELRLAEIAADAGFDCLWSAEHHFNDYSFVEASAYRYARPDANAYRHDGGSGPDRSSPLVPMPTPVGPAVPKPMPTTAMPEPTLLLLTPVSPALEPTSTPIAPQPTREPASPTPGQQAQPPAEPKEGFPLWAIILIVSGIRTFSRSTWDAKTSVGMAGAGSS